MAIDLQISNAWRTAAIDLGIRIVAPFEYETIKGAKLQFEAHVLDFGSTTGAIVMSSGSRISEEFAQLDRWHSVLAESYRTYDRQLFIDTLDDWQWYGERNRAPDWYTGKPWG